MAAKVFSGANVCLSRNLVPPELFDALHDALKFNGAQVILSCDPSRNGPADYHVIASAEHEKFEYLRSKDCKLLGPQCVLFCAKERRKLPNHGYTCCFALDGVNIVTSGFDEDVKANIGKKVTAMGGQLTKKASSDVSFVIVKDVLVQKYKWALTQVKKPIVTTEWLDQCWKEHRVVSHEPYRVPPFSGLTICVSGIPADERKEMEKLIIQNGGIYSAELTKRCSHLICDAPEGDKYMVAKRWRIIYIVNRKWFHQSIARRACLMEASFPVQQSSSVSTLKTLEHHTQGKCTRNSQPISSSNPSVSESDTNLSAQDMKPDVENLLTNILCTSPEVPHMSKRGNDGPTEKQKNVPDFTQCVADDSESEDGDLYLSECRILLLGFEASELRKLVSMVRQGGGSRYMSVRENLTHVVVGNPSEKEIKEIRSLAAFGVISIVKTSWLEECIKKKKDVPVFQGHIAYDLLLQKDSVVINGTTATSLACLKVGNLSVPKLADNNIVENENSQSDILFGLKEDSKVKGQSILNNGIKDMKSSTVFRGKLFQFSSTFPEEQRPEIVMWVTEGGGKVVPDQNRKYVHFIVERHGVVSSLTHASSTSYITPHWIHSCKEEGCLLDIGSHILYSPLQCKIPLPGFEAYRLCVLGYDMKEKQLLRNLCFILGLKYAEKLTEKVTHLLSKFAQGDKYQAACRWGMNVVTADWIYECAKQNKVVDVKWFLPKELTSQDRQPGTYFMSQYPAHSDRSTSADDVSQLPSQPHDLGNVHTIDSSVLSRDEELYSSSNKRAKLLGSHIEKHSSSSFTVDNFVSRMNYADNNTENNRVPSVVPDVAAVIEDLLEQTSKIQDLKSKETNSSHETFLSSNSTMLGQRHAASPSELGPQKQWINRSDERDDNPSDDKVPRGFYDGFSETQSDSQVVGYEEDLSGRQMIIDRVRTRSSMPGS
ncbi:DNA topoisomerase 2-binding protein 1-A-like [Salvia splendens]|uniref:DNA topoisomerase 2-binding protein 1-A-like n=1 Tax=Salvia splendens TaxID=180675 RepID=UPI001C26E388|nr:DNA topoisomerase 2-binding protein 1-A-like [Salvia splendens]